MPFTIISWTIFFISIYILRFKFPVLQIFRIWVKVSFSVKRFQYFESDIFNHHPWHRGNIAKDLRKGRQEIIKWRRETILISYSLTYSSFDVSNQDLGDHGPPKLLLFCSYACSHYPCSAINLQKLVSLRAVSFFPSCICHVCVKFSEPFSSFI